MYICDICEEMGCVDCMRCSWGNPCLGCLDYDEETNTCKSDGGCGRETKEEESEEEESEE